MNYSDVLLRLALSILLSGLIGYEREHTNKPAGFRTHILISVGSTTVMIANLLLFQKYGQDAGLDPTRLGAQVISGIGFLGAGTIIREGVNVKGLTTAASTWTVGCIGLVVGSGFYALGIGSTLVVLITLKAFGRLQYKKGLVKENFVLTIHTDDGFDEGELFTYLEDERIELLKYEKSDSKIDFVVNVNDNNYLKLLKNLTENEKVSYVNGFSKRK